MAWYTDWWFWLLIIGFIFVIVAIIVYEFYYKSNSKSATTWFWVLFGIGVFFIIVAVIVYLIGVSRPIKPPAVSLGPAPVEYVYVYGPPPQSLVDPCRPQCAPQCPPQIPPCSPKPQCAPAPQCPPSPCAPQCPPQSVAAVYPQQAMIYPQNLYIYTNSAPAVERTVSLPQQIQVQPQPQITQQLQPLQITGLSPRQESLATLAPTTTRLSLQ